MNNRNLSERTRYLLDIEHAEENCRRRLVEDLGLDEAGIEVALHLRRQLLDLQEQVHRLEAALQYQESSRWMYIARYRKMVVEAEWMEQEDTE